MKKLRNVRSFVINSGLVACLILTCSCNRERGCSWAGYLNFGVTTNNVTHEVGLSVINQDSPTNITLLKQIKRLDGSGMIEYSAEIECDPVVWRTAKKALFKEGSNIPQKKPANCYYITMLCDGGYREMVLQGTELPKDGAFRQIYTFLGEAYCLPNDNSFPQSNSYHVRVVSERHDSYPIPTNPPPQMPPPSPTPD